MKVLMFHGRAGGHNILPFLEYFNSSPEHELTFIYAKDRTYFPENCSIDFHKFSFSPLALLKLIGIIRKDYDLVWYHGGHSALIFFFFSLFRKKRTTFIFNVWNEWLIQKAKKGGLNGWMFKYGIKHADVIHCNWHGTANVLEETGWNTNIKVFYWGLQKENFIHHSKADSKETKQFIDSLPKNKVKFFFPKSISSNSRHDLVIEACNRLMKEGISDFVVYFWMGNTNNPSLLEKYGTQIKSLGLEKQVILQKHGFLSFGDMQLIWMEMDAGLQIAANEQLSTTFLEPQFYKKEILVTDIPPYRLYNKVFDLSIPLIPLTLDGVYDAMKQLIVKSGTTDKDVIEQRHEVVRNNFNFSSNIEKIVRHYERLTKH